MCKKYTKPHHTLLHRDSDYLHVSQRKPGNDEGKEEIHVAALSAREQMLLMTCKVKFTAPDGSSTIARALIDPGSSALFIHKRIAQNLHLQCSNKNASVEGVGGTSRCT